MTLKNKTGFTLIELLVVISIIGFIAAASLYAFTIARGKSRDSRRANDTTVIRSALANYKSDTGFYPIDSGSCLSDTILAPLITNNNIRITPLDPLWPTTAPAIVAGGSAQSGSSNFCYYYSSDGSSFYLSYFLETNSTAGPGGINIISGN